MFCCGELPTEHTLVYLYCNRLGKKSCHSTKLISDMEINMRTRTIHQQVQASKHTFGEKEHKAENLLCVGSQEKQHKRIELIMFSTEPLEHFRRSRPSSRTGTLMFHEFSGKTSSFPSIQRDDYTDPEKWNFLLEHKTCPTMGPPLFPSLFCSSIMRPGELVAGHPVPTVNQLELKEQRPWSLSLKNKLTQTFRRGSWPP